MLNNTEEILDKFAKRVIQQSRTRLTKGKKQFNKKLYNSLDYKLSVATNMFILQFIMEDYGMFQDKGVKGKNPSKVSPNAKITGQQAPNSPFRFGSGNYKGTFDVFAKRMSVWAKAKRVRFRDSKGRYTKGNYKSLGYIIAKNIYYRGLKPSNFFTKSFEQAFNKLPEDMVKAYRLDLEEFLRSSTIGN
jgi:hypothetical protein